MEVCLVLAMCNGWLLYVAANPACEQEGSSRKQILMAFWRSLWCETSLVILRWVWV